MKRLIPLLSLLLLAVPAWAQKVTLPAEVRGTVGAWVIIAPESVDGGSPRWRLDPGLQEVRLDLLLPPETLKQLRGKVVTALKDGRYKVEAWNARGDEASDIATCWVVIGTPGPGPGPDPNPPDPPGPVDPLTRTLQAAYDQQKDAEALAFLQSLVSQASKQVLGESVATSGQMLKSLWEASRANIGLTRAGPLRDAIADHLDPVLGTMDVRYTPQLRDEHSKAFMRLAEALKGVKP